MHPERLNDEENKPKEKQLSFLLKQRKSVTIAMNHSLILCYAIHRQGRDRLDARRFEDLVVLDFDRCVDLGTKNWLNPGLVGYG